ncbi:MAG: ComF family protein [Segniliparus sp.]|uniref:ComF family protein n=1 Tax=Segniliparus sp. TaxID=2804064 RepID=UPI003F3F047B
MDFLEGLQWAGRSVLDVLVPQECGGCRARGVAWCDCCDRETSPRPRLVRPEFDPGVPVYSSGRYGGARRSAVLAAKAHGRRDMGGVLGERLARVLAELRRRDVLPPGRGLRLVPAPSRARVSRARGGDPVLRMAAAASAILPRTDVEDLLRYRIGVRDSVGLGASERFANVRGRARVRARPSPAVGRSTVLVDDVLTSGSTACEAVRALAGAQVFVAAVVVVAG